MESHFATFNARQSYPLDGNLQLYECRHCTFFLLYRTHSYNPKHVIDEMVTTEQSYITDLSDIIDVCNSVLLLIRMCMRNGLIPYYRAI